MCHPEPLRTSQICLGHLGHFGSFFCLLSVARAVFVLLVGLEPGTQSFMNVEFHQLHQVALSVRPPVAKG